MRLNIRFIARMIPSLFSWFIAIGLLIQGDTWYRVAVWIGIGILFIIIMVPYKERRNMAKAIASQ